MKRQNRRIRTAAIRWHRFGMYRAHVRVLTNGRPVVGTQLVHVAGAPVDKLGA